MFLIIYTLLIYIIRHSYPLPYDPEQVPWNLNQNQTAAHPLDYWGQWDNHGKMTTARDHAHISNSCSIPSVARELAFPILYCHA